MSDPKAPVPGMEPISQDDVLAAAARIAGYAHRTPIATSTTLNQRVSAKVFLKCENFQRVGAFKFRGAYHALSRFSAEQRRRGVIAYSSGNHAQAIALAGRLLGIPATIVMPRDAPAAKLAATREYGAEIVLYDPATDTRERIAEEIGARQGLTVIPSFDHADVIAGQGTAALELFQETGPLDVLVVPCGGGGLLSGSAIVAAALSPGCRVIGVEPERADDATRSFRTRELQCVHNPDTIADGARTSSLGILTFPLVLRFVHDMVTVSDQALVEAVFFLLERMKLLVEPTGALGAAALLTGTIDAPGARTGVILSGGNVDLAALAGMFSLR